MGKLYVVEKFMPNFSRQFVKCLTRWVFLTSTILAAGICSASFIGEKNQMIISIEADKIPIKSLLPDILRQTDWKVVLDESLADSIVTGTFKEIELVSFLKRALKRPNLIFLYDEESKTIEVRGFLATNTKRAIAEGVSENIIPDEETLQALKDQAHRITEEYFSDPHAIEPLTGMTLGEISALQAEEHRTTEEYFSDPHAIEPLTGMTLGEISALHAVE